AVLGGRSPQSASISSSTETTSFARRRRIARSARCFPAASGIELPPSTTSSGPRIRNSIAVSSDDETDGNTLEDGGRAPSLPGTYLLLNRLSGPSESAITSKGGQMKTPTLALMFALLAVSAPIATAAVDPLDPGTCHHHGIPCPSHAGRPTRIVTIER